MTQLVRPGPALPRWANSAVRVRGMNVPYNFGGRSMPIDEISTEIALEGTQRLGTFTDKHRMMVGYHGHASASAADYETAFG